MASTSSLGAQSNTSTQEAQLFYSSFNARLRDVKQRIHDAVEAGELPSIFEDISKARTALTGKTDQLPSYDRQTHEQHLKEVNDLLAEKRSLLAPKTKFAFKRKPTSARAATTSMQTTSMEVPAAAKDEDNIAVSSSPSPPLSIRDKRGEMLDVSTLPRSDQATDLHILNLEDCIVDLRNLGGRLKFLALQLRNLHRCVILCGSIDGSTMIHECTETLISLQCRQFRMHSSRSMAILIITSSVATIEHCQAITFAPLSAPLKLPSIQDFDHISALEPSPNWSAMQPTICKTIEDALQSHPLPGIDTILHSAGLAKG